MMPEAIIGGIISKVINDCADISKTKIKEADHSRKEVSQNFETRLYQVTIDAFNRLTFYKYKNQDILYEAAEKLLQCLKSGEKDLIKIFRAGLIVLGDGVAEDRCDELISLLCQEIAQDKNSGLYKELDLFYKAQDSENNYVIMGELHQIKKGIYDLKESNPTNTYVEKKATQEKVRSRTKEYADKWNENMFLNNFDKRDENAGINVKLSEVYLNAHLPHYKWKENDTPSEDLKDLLGECITGDDREMLLILGQPGIGKSTLITWITAHFLTDAANIMVYQFAPDLKGVDWRKVEWDNDIIKEILRTLDLSLNDLHEKVLILDGFDEISIGNDRIGILNAIHKYWKENNAYNKFSLFITCRENYIEDINRIECNYITLLSWNRDQIISFCNSYGSKINREISKGMLEKILQNKEIMGIPLILYMLIALDISIEEGSILHIYEQIFSLEGGGIYDRCINNKRYGDEHRIREIKNQIHFISERIAMWMFEHHSEEASIPQREYKKICSEVEQEQKLKDEEIEKDFLIGNYFKLVKYCEGVETENLSFIHRSIYEYFVSETLYDSMKNTVKDLPEDGWKELSANLIPLLTKGKISEEISAYLCFKLNKILNNQIMIQRFEQMIWSLIQKGLFSYTDNILEINTLFNEALCFSNLLNIVEGTRQVGYVFEGYTDNGNFRLEIFNALQANMELSLRYLNLAGIHLENANLENVDLKYANLENANLEDANLNNANLRHANLKNIKLRNANLQGTIVDISNIKDIIESQDIIRIKHIMIYLNDRKITTLAEYLAHFASAEVLHNYLKKQGLVE